MRTRGTLAVGLAALGALIGVAAGPAAAKERPGQGKGYRYDIPVPARSPWPEVRRDRRNTGWSPIRARYRPGDRPWHLSTAKGIFSTPVIGADGTVYAGSADRSFYAVGADGHVRWRFRTGGIIDSAAVLGRRDPELGASTVTFGSGDENLYRLRRTNRDIARKRRVLWRFTPPQPPGQGQLVNWWEGNVVLGPDGTLYAGNTGGGVYALNPDGTQKWSFPTGNAVWSAVAIGDDGRLFFDSLDLFIYAADRDGEQAWSKPTVGFNASSPAIGSDGTVYVGSFDSNVYALDPDTGLERWRLTTDDHVYSSPALAEDPSGRTTAVFVGSTDGGLYAITPNGKLLWRYETGDPLRSSPVVGRAPGGRGEIVYVGSSNGKLYAINADDGTRRWSYDTTPKSRLLRDRNDLNGSPALGRRGIYIGGEHGRLVYVPYEWCRRAGRGTSRCETDPGDEFPDRATRVYPVSSGGNTSQSRRPRTQPAATLLNGRLVVRRGGQTIDAALQQVGSATDLVSVEPPFPFTAQLSGDGHYLHVLPTGFLRPGAQYSLRFSGRWAGEGAPVGNTNVGATRSGTFDDEIRVRTNEARLKRPQLSVSRRRVTALRLSRLAVPLPPLLPSVNQIGFDSYDWIAGTLERSKPHHGKGTILLWIVGSRKRGGKLVADPNSDFAFPLVGRYDHDSVILSQRDLTLTFSFGDVPIDLIEFRGQLRPDLRMRPGASLYAEVTCANVPNYGPFLPLTGLCNPEGKLIASGTYLTGRYPRGPANRRPNGLHVDEVHLDRPTPVSDGEAVATLSLRHGARYPARRHVASILLVDADTGEPVGLDYNDSTSIEEDGRGNIAQVSVEIPSGTNLPSRVRAYVIADVFPLHAEEFGG